MKLEPSSLERKSVARANELTAILSSAERGGFATWDRGGRCRVFRAQPFRFDPIEINSNAAKTPSPQVIEFRRESLPWYDGKRERLGRRIVAEGIIISAEYLLGDRWIPLDDEIGKPV